MEALIFMKFEITKALLTPEYNGLTNNEAAQNQKLYGRNVRLGKQKKTSLQQFAGIFTEPMMLLLIATALLYFILGDKIQAAVMLCSVFPIGLIEFWQQKRTDNALLVLDRLLVFECEVYRDGEITKLPATELVPGDVLYLNAGDKIPADAIVINSPGFMVDESVLTGESVPVVKRIGATLGQISDEHKLFQGTVVVQGEGYAVVMATGEATSYGALGTLLQKIEFTKTPLQAKIEKLIRSVAIIAIGVALVIGVVLAMTKGITHGILASLTVAIAIIPEEFPIVFSVFLIMGVWRMTKRQALIRQMTMVETLGSVTVICTDKTGTLTEGTMRLVEAYTQRKFISAGEIHNSLIARQLVHDAFLALEQVAIDPIEIEMQRVASTFGITKEVVHKRHTLHRDSSFDAATKMVHHTWKREDGEYFQYTAGAPEGIIDATNLSETEKNKTLKAHEDLARRGYRVIAIAATPHKAATQFMAEQLQFVGLLALQDPVRKGVAAAVAECRGAGIRICMITGDNYFTAEAIAKEIKLADKLNIINGDDFAKKSPAEVLELVKTTNIFVRVRPEHKFLIVEALQKNGEIVAMTGDGVNDAPALKKANIGVAMGLNGTEVAREAAGIVLLDDDFSTIVKAIHEGRRIYDNLRQAFVFLFTFHIPIVGLSLVPILFGQDLFFLPIHIIFLEFVGDPTGVLGFERDPARRGVMRSPPRPANEPLLNPALWWRIAVQGVGITAVTLGLYYYYDIVEGSLALGRTIAFSVLVITQIFVVFVSREIGQIKKNGLLIGIAAFTLLFLFVALTVPAVRSVFVFSELDMSEFLVMGASAALTVALVKVLAARRAGS